MLAIAPSATGGAELIFEADLIGEFFNPIDEYRFDAARSQNTFDYSTSEDGVADDEGSFVYRRTGDRSAVFEATVRSLDRKGLIFTLQFVDQWLGTFSAAGRSGGVQTGNFQLVSPPLSTGGTRTVEGTAGDDEFVLSQFEDILYVTLNNQTVKITGITSGDAAQRLVIRAGAGHDSVRIDQTNGKLNYPLEVFGEADNDTLVGGDGNDTLSGGAGKNELAGGPGDDRLSGSSGPDRLYGGNGADRLYGNGGRDYLEGGNQTDRMYGGDGDDTLLGGGSMDRLYGEGGRDTLRGDLASDLLDGGADTDKREDFDSADRLIDIP